MRALLVLLLAAAAFADEREVLDAKWIEANLRFALARKGEPVDKTIGVYMGRGTSAPSAIAVVRRLDELKRPPRLLFERHFLGKGLSGLKTLVMPGGWAPSILGALGPKGRAALKELVHEGGNYLGICAGGYLACEGVEWEGKSYPYPLGMAAGVAKGPIDALAKWPKSASTRIRIGLKGPVRIVLYSGGSSFHLKHGEVVAHYSNMSAAAVDVRYGKGRLILTGAHPEFDRRTDKDLLKGWADDIDCGDGAVFRAFLKRFSTRPKGHRRSER